MESAEIHGHIGINNNILKGEYRIRGGVFTICANQIEYGGKKKENTCIDIEADSEKSVKAKISYTHTPFLAPPAYYYIPGLRPNPYQFRQSVVLVVDTNPALNVFGLPEQHSTVITTTKRTVLEGFSPPQLLITENDKPYLADPRSILFTHPIMGPSWVIDEAKLCEKYRSWGQCIVLVSKTYRIDLCKHLASLDALWANGSSSFHISQLIAIKHRILEPIAYSQKIEPIKLVNHTLQGGVIEEIVNIVPLAPRTIGIRRKNPLKTLEIRIVAAGAKDYTVKSILLDEETLEAKIELGSSYRGIYFLC